MFYVKHVWLLLLVGMTLELATWKSRQTHHLLCGDSVLLLGQETQKLC